MRLHYDITLPWIRISDWTKVAKRNRWVRADVSVVIMTSHSSWIKSSNWTKVTQQYTRECAAIMRSHSPYKLLLRSSGWSSFSQWMRTIGPRVVLCKLRHWIISSSVLKAGASIHFSDLGGGGGGRVRKIGRNIKLYARSAPQNW